MNLVLKSTLMLALFSFVIYACDDMIPEPKVAEDHEEEEPDTISFSNHIIPIFENNCVSCHSSGPAPELDTDPYDHIMDGYVVAGDAEESSLYIKINDQGDAHYNRIDDEGREQIRLWIEQGAEDN